MTQPSSRKELEEAGRRKLEEFRKQRAASKAQATQPPPAPPAVSVPPQQLVQQLSTVLPVSTSAGLQSLGSGPLSGGSLRLDDPAVRHAAAPAASYHSRTHQPLLQAPAGPAAKPFGAVPASTGPIAGATRIPLQPSLPAQLTPPHLPSQQSPAPSGPAFSAVSSSSSSSPLVLQPSNAPIPFFSLGQQKAQQAASSRLSAETIHQSPASPAASATSGLHEAQHGVSEQVSASEHRASSGRLAEVSSAPAPHLASLPVPSGPLRIAGDREGAGVVQPRLPTPLPGPAARLALPPAKDSSAKPSEAMPARRALSSNWAPEERTAAPSPMQSAADAYASLSDSYLAAGARNQSLNSAAEPSGTGADGPMMGDAGAPLVAEPSLEDWARHKPGSPDRHLLSRFSEASSSGPGQVSAAKGAQPFSAAAPARPSWLSQSSSEAAAASPGHSPGGPAPDRTSQAGLPAVPAAAITAGDSVAHTPSHDDSPATTPGSFPRQLQATGRELHSKTAQDSRTSSKSSPMKAGGVPPAQLRENGDGEGEHADETSVEGGSSLPNGHSAAEHRGSEVSLRPKQRENGDKAWTDGPPPPPAWLASLTDGHSSSGPRSSGRDFSLLQQHIDDLTQQKFELARGLEGQRKVSETLATENQALTEDFNRQGQTVQELRAEIASLHAEVKAQHASMNSMAAEREASRAAVAESSDASQRLAREVVALEEKLLQAQSQQLKAERAAESSQDEVKRAGTSCKRAQLECSSLNATLSALQEEKKALNAKLRKATLSASLNAEHPPRDIGTQTDPISIDSPPPKTPRTPRHPSRPLAGASVIEHPSQDAFSARVTAATMSQHLEASAEGQEPPQLPEAVAWLLPVTIWSGGVGGAAALMIAEERTTLDSIHALLDAIEGDKRGLLSQIEGYKARCNDLGAANQRLERKLDLATQRFELAVASASFSGLRSSRLPSRQPTGESTGIPDRISNPLEPSTAPSAADTDSKPPPAPSGTRDSQWSLQKGQARSGSVPELPDDGRGQSGAATSIGSRDPPQMPGQGSSPLPPLSGSHSRGPLQWLFGGRGPPASDAGFKSTRPPSALL